MSRNTTNLEGRPGAELGVQLLEAINRSAPMEEIIALVERGAEVNIQDNDGWTPLYWAYFMNNAELPALLINHGADVNIQDNNGWTPLYWACFMNNAELRALLINHGADVNIAGNNGNTPLCHASFTNNNELAYVFLNHGADVNIAGNNGNTPLHHACLHNNLELATVLLNHRADVDLSLLKAFVGQNEWPQIDEIINNQTFEHVNLHLRDGANRETIAILDMLYFSEDYAGLIHFVDNENQPLMGDSGALPHLYAEMGLK